MVQSSAVQRTTHEAYCIYIALSLKYPFPLYPSRVSCTPQEKASLHCLSVSVREWRPNFRTGSLIIYMTQRRTSLHAASSANPGCRLVDFTSSLRWYTTQNLLVFSIRQCTHSIRSRRTSNRLSWKAHSAKRMKCIFQPSQPCVWKEYSSSIFRHSTGKVMKL